MALSVMPYVRIQEFTNDGDPAVGYQLFTYVAGSTTKLATYSNYAGTVANTNPIILDSAGSAEVFLLDTLYKFVLAPPDDTDPPTSPVWTRDNIQAIPLNTGNLDIDGTAGETITAGTAVYCSDGSGSKTAGLWYKTDSTNLYSSRGANALGLAVTNNIPVPGGFGALTVRVSGRYTGFPTSLTAGVAYYLSTTPGVLSSASSNATRIFGFADSTSSLIISHWPPDPDASATAPGIISTGAQTIPGAKTFAAAGVFSTTLGVTGIATFTAHPVVTKGAIASPVVTVLHADPAVYKAVTPADNTATGWTMTVPAGTLGANGSALRVTVAGLCTSNAAVAKSLQVVFGTTPVEIEWQFSAGVLNGSFTVLIQRRDATTVVMSAHGFTETPTTCTAYATGTETFANALTLATRHGAGSDSDDYVSQVGIVVEYLQAP